jgi:hypothetical protein
MNRERVIANGGMEAARRNKKERLYVLTAYPK